MIAKVFNYINSISGDNKFIAGAVSVWGLGILSWVARDIPKKFFNFIIKQSTTELITTSQNKIFHELLSWLEKNNFSNKFRKIKISNGQWGSDNEVVKSVGYGKHIIWYKKRPILISFNKLESKETWDKEQISLTKIGRDHKLFDNFIKSIVSKDNMFDQTEVYFYEKYWQYNNKQPQRKEDTIFIENDKIVLLKKTLDNFIKNEKWYIEHGVPYQLGILLYGPPGTGKTSLIKFIAAYLKKTLSVINVDKLSSITQVFAGLPKNSIAVIEDVDSCSAVIPRKNKKKLAPEEDAEEENYRMSFASLSEILNAIDGIVSIHGRILIMSTNHPEKLDGALMRPGRIDLKLEIGYINNEIFYKFMSKFFVKEFNTLKNKNNFKTKNLSVATLQNDFLSGLTFEEILKKHTETSQIDTIL